MTREDESSTDDSNSSWVQPRDETDKKHRFSSRRAAIQALGSVILLSGCYEIDQEFKETTLKDPPITALHTDSWTQQQRLPFGNAVALSHNQAFIADDSHLYIYDIVDGHLNRAQKIRTPAASAIAVSGSHLLVGAPNNTRAYIIRQSQGRWKRVRKIAKEPETETAREFGERIALNERHIVIGDQRNNEARIFQYSGDEVRWVQTLSAEDAELDNFDVNAVAINKDYIFIGCTREPTCIFRQHNNRWELFQKLFPDDTDSNIDRFGSSVALSGNQALVGEIWDSEFGYTVGAAHIFEFDGREWERSQKLVPAENDIGDFFGAAVSLDEDYAVIGAPHESSDGAMSSAYIFKRGERSWLQAQELFSSRDNGFGATVAINGNIALIAAAGAVYFYERTLNSKNMTQEKRVY